MEQNIGEILNLIAQVIYNKKGANILALDVKGFSSITDYIIIAEGTIERHNQAIAHAIIDEMKKHDERPQYVEGMHEGQWIVIDYLDVIIHIFIPELREKYQLEKLFEQAKIVDVKIDVPSTDERNVFGEKTL